MRGGSSISLPAAGESYYKLNCLAYQPGTHAVRVKFNNLDDGEFMFYDLKVEFTESNIQKTIPLETMCRQSMKYVISIENPVPEEGKISLPDDWWSCSSDEVRVRELADLSGPAETNIEVEFRPLCVMRDSKADLTIKCNKLGQYNYALLLSATEAGLERSLNFKAPLGGTQNKIFRFTSLLQRLRRSSRVRSASHCFSVSTRPSTWRPRLRAGKAARAKWRCSSSPSSWARSKMC